MKCLTLGMTEWPKNYALQPLELSKAVELSNEKLMTSWLSVLRVPHPCQISYHVLADICPDSH